MIALAAVAVVVAIAAVFVIVKVSTGSSGGSAAGSAPTSGGTRLSAAQYAAVTSPSVTTLAQAAKNYDHESLAYPSKITDHPLSTKGKPEVLYIGAEYCPFCATERWPLILALSKFGTFGGLSEIHSNTSDAGIEHLATLSFYQSGYTSKYLAFKPVEMQNTLGQTLDTPTKSEIALLKKYTGGDIPLVDMDGKFAITSAELDAHLLAGLDQSEIIEQVKAGTSTLAANIDADAGAIISNLCQLTGGRPGNVCSAFPNRIQSPS
jgi:hypothetical protein